MDKEFVLKLFKSHIISINDFSDLNINEKNIELLFIKKDSIKTLKLIKFLVNYNLDFFLRFFENDDIEYINDKNELLQLNTITLFKLKNNISSVYFIIRTIYDSNGLKNEKIEIIEKKW